MKNIDDFLRSIADKQGDILKEYKQALPQDIISRLESLYERAKNEEAKGGLFQDLTVSETIDAINEADRLHQDIDANRDKAIGDLMTGKQLNPDGGHRAINAIIKLTVLCPAFMDEETRGELKDRVSELDEVSRYRNYIINIDRDAPFRASDGFRFIAPEMLAVDFVNQDELNKIIGELEAKERGYTP